MCTFQDWTEISASALDLISVNGCVGQDFPAQLDCAVVNWQKRGVLSVYMEFFLSH